MTPWPWPGDSPIDRARRIARSYREIAAEHAPRQTAAVDARFAELGESWPTPQPVTIEPDEWVTLDVAAEHPNVSVGRDAIDKWLRRDPPRLVGRLGADGRLRVRFGDVLDAQGDLRRARAGRRVDRTATESP